MKLNSVVSAKSAMPNHINCGNIFRNITPARSTQDTILLAKETTGTRAERIFIQA